MRKLRKILALALGEADPADAGDVGNGITPGQKFALGKARVHDAVEPVDLVRIALERIRDLLRRVTAEVDRLPRHRAEPAHLPEQPLVDRDAGALVARIELSGLAAEILQDGAGLEHRDGPPAGAVRIDNGGEGGVWGNREKARRELLALGNIARVHDVRQPALLEHDGNFPAVRRRPVVERDRRGAGGWVSLLA